MLLYYFACERLFKVLVFVSDVGGRKASSAQTLLHSDEIVTDFLVLLFHQAGFNYYANNDMSR